MAYDSWELFPEKIRKSGLTIYDPVEIGSPLWIPAADLEKLLNRGLHGLDLAGLPLRTRSKIVKTEVCRSLGYPIPISFVKTKPRFLGQLFDTYIQKANNLQVWNEELAATRRYVVIRVGEDFKVKCVKVVTGDVLALLDTTGTLTQKYQARLVPGSLGTELISSIDTDLLRHCVSLVKPVSFQSLPTANATVDCLLPISEIFSRICPLVGSMIRDPGIDQERNRGGELHRSVCRALGYMSSVDDGQFPDIKHQLLEVKLQTSPTIDLGLVTPASKEPLDLPQLEGVQLRHCDVRYALFYGHSEPMGVRLTNLFVTTGEKFFSRFTQFGGKVLNKKLQIPLPKSFFFS